MQAVLAQGRAALHAVLGAEALGEWRLPAAARVAGWLLLGAGAAITVAAQRQMGASWRVGIDDRPTELVTGGLFRVVRNPIFSGLLVFLAGFVLLAPAWWSIGIWVLTALGQRVQVAHEEKHLQTLHGATYLDYASRVGRFVPLVGRLR
jgi:protein-S-isoprenylcysteine O-methyltransferase Ste14